jgi:hypothetical protein
MAAPDKTDPRKRTRPLPFNRNSSASHRTVPDVWSRIAGEMAVIADLATQAAGASRRHDAKALDALADNLRIAIMGAIGLHSKHRNTLDKEIRS